MARKGAGMPQLGGGAPSIGANRPTANIHTRHGSGDKLSGAGQHEQGARGKGGKAPTPTNVGKSKSGKFPTPRPC